VTPAQWHRLQRAAAATAVGQLSRLWRQLEGTSNFGAAWNGQQAATIVATSQRVAAARASEYVAAQIGEQGAPSATVRADAFAGVASDGRPLATLLRLPAASTIQMLNRGEPEAKAFTQGRRRLGKLAATQVFDAGRVATSVAQTVDTRVAGYRRELRGPTNCARCVVLAGKWFRWNEGFLRHPGCDCVHVPTTQSNATDFEPELYFEGLTPEQQDATFGQSGAQAIRDGGDLGQVVNARRGMKTTTAYGRKVLSTTEGTTVRATFGRRAAATGEVSQQGSRYRQATTIRLMPEQIYLDAKDRTDAIRLLGVHGYI